MKRFILRGPRLLARTYQLYGARIVPPLATNIDIDSAVLRSLNLSIHKWEKRPNSQYELLPSEVGKVRLLGGPPIVGIEEWRGTVGKVLGKARCYPSAVFEVLWQTCGALVYSHPSLRRKLIEDILDGLKSADYPVTNTMYYNYLSSIWTIRQSIDIAQIFEDLDRFNLALNYDTHENVLLADMVCMFLALQGESAAIQTCWESFVKTRAFPGFTDRSFSVIATSHITRGEYDELHKLQSTLEQSDPINMKVATKFYSNVVFSLARMGQIDLLETVLKKDKFGCLTGMVGIFYQLCVELIESGNEAYILEILPLFQGLDFQHGRKLEALTCDLLSRGAHRVGADLIVHGGDLFKFKDERQQDIFERETLPDIISNMTDNLDNILIQVELRGINTKYTFDFDKIDDSIVKDIDELQDEFPELDWIKDLYDHKMRTVTNDLS